MSCKGQDDREDMDSTRSSGGLSSSYFALEWRMFSQIKRHISFKLNS